MSGSYLVSENGDPSNRTGGLSISVCAPDGNVIGGAVGGSLIASSLVQVFLHLFVLGCIAIVFTFIIYKKHRVNV